MFRLHFPMEIKCIVSLVLAFQFLCSSCFLSFCIGEFNYPRCKPSDAWEWLLLLLWMHCFSDDAGAAMVQAAGAIMLLMMLLLWWCYDSVLYIFYEHFEDFSHSLHLELFQLQEINIPLDGRLAHETIAKIFENQSSQLYLVKMNYIGCQSKIHWITSVTWINLYSLIKSCLPEVICVTIYKHMCEDWLEFYWLAVTWPICSSFLLVQPWSAIPSPASAAAAVTDSESVDSALLLFYKSVLQSFCFLGWFLWLLPHLWCLDSILPFLFLLV